MAASSASTSATAPARPPADRRRTPPRRDRRRPVRPSQAPAQRQAPGARPRPPRSRRSTPSPGAFPPGAALVDGDAAWVLVEDEPERGLGPALAWAVRNGADVAARARRARRPGCWPAGPPASRFPIDGLARRRSARCCPAVAEPPVVPPPADPAHLELVDTIIAGGAVPVVEHGVVTGEVRGLEVCRVVDDPHTGAVRLEVGVGAHDREAFTIIHGDVPTVEALAGVVRAVVAAPQRRRAAAPAQPPRARAPAALAAGAGPGAARPASR